MRSLTILTLAFGLGLGLQPALAQSPAGTNKAFCAEGGQDNKGPTCSYDTLAQCEAAIKGQSTAKCGPNPKMTKTK